MFLNTTIVNISQQKYIIFKSVFLWPLQIWRLFDIIQLVQIFFNSDEVKHKNKSKTRIYVLHFIPRTYVYMSFGLQPWESWIGRPLGKRVWSEGRENNTSIGKMLEDH